MKIQKKFLLIFIIVNIVLSFIYLNKFQSRADDDDDKSFIEKMETGASSFISSGQKAADDTDNMSDVTDAVTEEFSGLGQFLTMIGAGVMVAVVSYMGIQYIISPPDKQAALKQQLIGVVVAGIVIFGAYGIWKAILGIVSNF